MIEGYEHFVGIDWGNEHHQVCVVDRRGKVVEKRRVPNNGEGLQAVVELCQKWAHAAVGIETPRGALVETLLAAQVPVFHINPKQAERIRERYNAAGAKDDRLDAFSAADGLRTDSVDRPCFRRVEVTPDHLAELQTIGRLDQSMTKDRVRVQNRLREAVLLVHPALLTLCVGADEAWLWAVLEQFVGAARKPLTAEVQAILRKHRIRRVSAEAIVAALRQEGAKVSDGSMRAAKITIRALVPQLRCIEQEQRTLAKQLREILKELESGTAEGQSSEHRDVAILRSMPGVGDKTAAAMLAEVPQFLRTRNYPALRAINRRRPRHRRHGEALGEPCDGQDAPWVPDAASHGHAHVGRQRDVTRPRMACRVRTHACARKETQRRAPLPRRSTAPGARGRVETRDSLRPRDPVATRPRLTSPRGASCG